MGIRPPEQFIHNLLVYKQRVHSYIQLRLVNIVRKSQYYCVPLGFLRQGAKRMVNLRLRPEYIINLVGSELI